MRHNPDGRKWLNHVECYRSTAIVSTLVKAAWVMTRGPEVIEGKLKPQDGECLVCEEIFIVTCGSVDKCLPSALVPRSMYWGHECCVILNICHSCHRKLDRMILVCTIWSHSCQCFWHKLKWLLVYSFFFLFSPPVFNQYYLLEAVPTLYHLAGLVGHLVGFTTTVSLLATPTLDNLFLLWTRVLGVGVCALAALVCATTASPHLVSLNNVEMFWWFFSRL